MSFAQTPEQEQQNLNNIALELAERPDLERWALANPDIANHVGDIHKLYPWLPPGVTLALGTARYAPDDPFVKQLADNAMQFGRKLQSAGFGDAAHVLADPSFAQALDKNLIGTEIKGVTPTPHRGFLDTVAGDVGGALGTAAHAVGSTIGGGIPSPVRDFIKTDARWGFAGLQAGLEGVAAAGRNLAALHQAVPASDPESYGLMHSPVAPVPQFTAGNTVQANLPGVGGTLGQLTLVQMLNGRNAGSGFFPSGQAAQAAHQAQLNAASITGTDGQPHAWTYGRGLAGAVLPANSRAYGVVSGLGDAAVALYADPAQLALGKVGELRALQKGIAEPGYHWGESGGILDQFRQSIGIRTAAEQLNSHVGQGIIRKLADTTSFSDIHNGLFNGKVDGQISLALAHADSPEAVRAILNDELGTGIGSLPTFHPALQALTQGHATDAFGNVIDQGGGSLGYLVNRTVRDWRPMALMPGPLFHTDLTQSWARNENLRNMEAHLINARVPRELIDPVLERVAGATNRVQLYDAFKDGMNVEADNLHREFAIPTAKAREMTRAWTSLSGEGRDTYAHFMDSLTDKVVQPGMNVDGRATIFDGPHLPTEMLSNSIKFPDFREIRKAASDYRKFVEAHVAGGHSVLAAQDFGTTALDAFMHLWKGAQLIRPALMVRILGESQLAMAAGGDASLFRHPLDWISYVTGRKGATDITEAEHAFSPADFNQVWKGGTGQVVGFDPKRVWSSQWTQIARGQNGFVSSWAQEVRHMHIDQLSRETAAAMIGGERPGARTVQELKDAFYTGHLRQTRVDMMVPNGRWQEQLGTRGVADEYIDSVVRRIRILTRDDPELMSAIADGSFRGERLAQLKDGKQLIGRAAYEKPPQAVQDRLAELDAAGNAPEHVKGFLYGSTKLGPGSIVGAARDRAMGRAFNMLIGTPIQTLAASPHFRQQYFREVEKLLPYMDPQEAERVVARAEKAGIHGLDARKAAGSLDANMVDTVAKSRSLDTMSTMLHDLGHRSQASDMLRFVAPFGDAWKKVITRWVKLIGENPATVERFRQGIHEGTQSGFVHTDQYGKQVFTIPFSAGVDKAITGLPFPMEAPLNGLSIVGSGLPGIGPAVSVPLGLIAPHVPVLNDVLKTIAPYGTPNVRQGVLEAFLPGYLNRFRTAGLLGPVGPSADEQSTFMHTIDEVLRYGVSTGKYDLTTPDKMAAAVADARHRATLLYAVRGMMQWVSPSPPTPDIMVKDKSGRLTAAYVLAQELQNLYNGKGTDGKGKNDATQANQIFLRLHGDANYLMLQPFTTPRRYGLPATVDMAKWVQSHPGFKKDFPNVYGMLVPQKGAFDYKLYQEQIASGERVDRTSDEFVRLANSRIAAMVYDQERNKLPDNIAASDKSNYLAWLRADLVKRYPGYQDQSLQQPKATVPAAIAELAKAADDPAVRNSDAAVAVREYLGLRQQVIDWEKQNGSNAKLNSLSSAQQFDGAHAWLDQQASRLITAHPTFAPVWDMLLSFEVTLAPTPTPAGP